MCSSSLKIKYALPQICSSTHHISFSFWRNIDENPVRIAVKMFFFNRAKKEEQKICVVYLSWNEAIALCVDSFFFIPINTAANNNNINWMICRMGPILTIQTPNKEKQQKRKWFYRMAHQYTLLWFFPYLFGIRSEFDKADIGFRKSKNQVLYMQVYLSVLNLSYCWFL